MTSTYITTTIPYVNARPHLGHALEFVHADALARYRRSAGDQVRLQAGTDDNSLKNVLAAEAAGVGVQEFVDANAAAFSGLAVPLGLSIDDLIRTSGNPRHRAGVERFWRACAARGDLTALDYASGGENLVRWWTGAERRVHLLGKGVLRFHAVYWPAMLLSAGEAVPTDIVVHGYLTENGRKIAKSSGAPGSISTVDPYDLADRYGTDAVRWWLLREVPKGADADFTAGRLVARANDELANGFGNLVNRVVSMIHQYCDGRVPQPGGGASGAPAGLDAATLDETVGAAPRLIAEALDDFDFRRATEAVWRIADEANRYVNRAPPVGPGRGGGHRGAGRGPVRAAARLPGLRRAPGAVPARRRGPHHRAVHGGPGRPPSAARPAAASD